MTTRSLENSEVLELLGLNVQFLAQGQTPNKSGQPLVEKEYIGRAITSEAAAIKLAVENFKNDHHGETIYTRGIVASECDGEFMAVVFAALRVPSMDFSEALVNLKCGTRIRRLGWNGKDQFVYLHSIGAAYQPCFVLRNAQGLLQPGWVPSMGDLLASDWEVYNPE